MNGDESIWITGVGAATPLGFELELEQSPESEGALPLPPALQSTPIIVLTANAGDTADVAAAPALHHSLISRLSRNQVSMAALDGNSQTEAATELKV